jgi:hypothetical protein
VKVLGVTYQGAAYAIQRLVDADVVAEAPSPGSARLYLAKDVLEVLEGPTE